MLVYIGRHGYLTRIVNAINPSKPVIKIITTAVKRAMLKGQ